MALHDPRAIARDWLARFATRLDTLAPILQAEVISTVHTKASLAAMSDGRIRWAADDLTLCIKRLLSRQRVHKFGKPPEDAGTFRQQMAACAAELGLHSPWAAA